MTILGFVGHASLFQLLISATVAQKQLYLAALTSINEHNCVPITFYLQKQVAGQIWALGHRFANL